MPNEEATIPPIKPAKTRISIRGTAAAPNPLHSCLTPSIMLLTILLTHSADFLATCSVFLAESTFCEAIAVCFAASVALLTAISDASTEAFLIRSAFWIVRLLVLIFGLFFLICFLIDSLVASAASSDALRAEASSLSIASWSSVLSELPERACLPYGGNTGSSGSINGCCLFSNRGIIF